MSNEQTTRHTLASRYSDTHELSSVGQLIVETAVLDSMKASRYSDIADIKSQRELVDLTSRLVVNRVYNHMYNGFQTHSDIFSHLAE